MNDQPAEPAAPLPMHLRPLQGPPPADYVAGTENEILHGAKFEYRYTSGREYRLEFTRDAVKFTMLDAIGFKPDFGVPVALPYFARWLRQNQILVHWMVPGRVGHVALVIDFELRKVFVSALMPFKMEFFDEAQILLFEQRPEPPATA